MFLNGWWWSNFGYGTVEKSLFQLIQSRVPFTWQSREALKKFMESLIGKTGKLRSLIRELETKYDDTAATS
jgi:hypothetical protein